MKQPSTKVTRAAKQLLRALDRGDHWSDAFARVVKMFDLSETQGRRVLAKVDETDPRAAEAIESELGADLFGPESQPGFRF